jgi:hypothetical protein
MGSSFNFRQGLPDVIGVNPAADGITALAFGTEYSVFGGNVGNVFFDEYGEAYTAVSAQFAGALSYSNGQFYMEPYEYSLTPNFDFKFASNDLATWFDNSGFHGPGDNITIVTGSGPLPLTAMEGNSIFDGNGNAISAISAYQTSVGFNTFFPGITDTSLPGNGTFGLGNGSIFGDGSSVFVTQPLQVNSITGVDAAVPNFPLGLTNATDSLPGDGTFSLMNGVFHGAFDVAVTSTIPIYAPQFNGDGASITNVAAVSLITADTLHGFTWDNEFSQWTGEKIGSFDGLNSISNGGIVASALSVATGWVTIDTLGGVNLSTVAATTSDPGIQGQLYNLSGVVMISL